MTFKPAVHGIPNFVQVSDGIYRGGQPGEDGWRYLSSLGVSNVIKLNLESEGSDAGASSLGMTVHEVPISIWKQIFGPVKPMLIEGLTNITAGTFVHCSHGVNRTGSEIAIYRMSHGWTRKEAIQEADSLGWRTTFPALQIYVRYFAP